MESLARTVMLLWVLSFALSLTALLFAVLYRQSKAKLRGATVWLVLSAADIAFYLYTSWRFVIIQMFVWMIALALVIRTAKSASPTP